MAQTVMLGPEPPLGSYVCNVCNRTVVPPESVGVWTCLIVAIVLQIVECGDVVTCGDCRPELDSHGH